MINPECPTQTYMRTVENDTIDRINGALDDLATAKDYFRPAPIKSPLGFFVMSIRSYTTVSESIEIGMKHDDLDHLYSSESDSVTKEPIAAVPFGVRFPTPRGRSDNDLVEEMKASGFNTLRGVRKIMLELKPVNDKLFCPPEFKNATRLLGANEFYDKPVLVRLGWTDLQTRSEVMSERREEILETVSSVAPFVLMSAITVEHSNALMQS